MDVIFLILAIVYGVLMGIGAALAITGSILMKSNKHGDTKGAIANFNGKSLTFIRREKF